MAEPRVQGNLLPSPYSTSSAMPLRPYDPTVGAMYAGMEMDQTLREGPRPMLPPATGPLMLPFVSGGAMKGVESPGSYQTLPPMSDALVQQVMQQVFSDWVDTSGFNNYLMGPEAAPIVTDPFDEGPKPAPGLIASLAQQPDFAGFLPTQQQAPTSGGPWKTGWERVAEGVGQEDYNHPYYEQAMQWQEEQARNQYAAPVLPPPTTPMPWF